MRSGSARSFSRCVPRSRTVVPGGRSCWVRARVASDRSTWLGSVNALTRRYGNDGPEAQYESLYQTVTGAGREMPNTTDGGTAIELTTCDVASTASAKEITALARRFAVEGDV